MCEDCGRLLCPDCLRTRLRDPVLGAKGCSHQKAHKAPPSVLKLLSSQSVCCEYCEASIIYSELQSHTATHFAECEKCKATYPIFPGSAPHDCIAFLAEEVTRLKRSQSECFGHFADCGNEDSTILCPKLLAAQQRRCAVCERQVCGICSRRCRLCSGLACETCFGAAQGTCHRCDPPCRSCQQPLNRPHSPGKKCKLCEGVCCLDCSATCWNCARTHCPACKGTCKFCSSPICKECGKYACASCKAPCCKKCAVQGCAQCSSTLCRDCAKAHKSLSSCVECGKVICDQCAVVGDKAMRIRYCSECKTKATAECPRCGTTCQKERLVRCETCSCAFCNLELYWRCEACEKTVCEDCGEILRTREGRYHYYCKGCIVQCEGCKQRGTAEDMPACAVCSRRFCSDCHGCAECAGCKGLSCAECTQRCEECDDPYCKRCSVSALQKCSKCQLLFCKKELKQCAACGIVSCHKCLPALSQRCIGCNKCGVPCPVCKTLICPLSMHECIICHKLFGNQCSVEASVAERLRGGSSSGDPPYICVYCKEWKRPCGRCGKIGCFCPEKCRCHTVCVGCKVDCCRDCSKLCRRCRKTYCLSCSEAVSETCSHCGNRYKTHQDCPTETRGVCDDCTLSLIQCECRRFTEPKRRLRCRCGKSLCPGCVALKCNNCGRAYCEECRRGGKCVDCGEQHCEKCQSLLLSGTDCVDAREMLICRKCGISGSDGTVKRCAMNRCRAQVCRGCLSQAPGLVCVCGSVYCSESCAREARRYCAGCKAQRCVRCRRNCVGCEREVCLACSKECSECRKVICWQCQQNKEKTTGEIVKCDGCGRELCRECKRVCSWCSWKLYEKDIREIRVENGNFAICCYDPTQEKAAAGWIVRGNLEFLSGIHRFQVHIKYNAGDSDAHDSKEDRRKWQGFGVCPRAQLELKRIIGVFMNNKARHMVPGAVALQPQGRYVVTVDRLQNTVTIEGSGGKLSARGRLEAGVAYVPCFSFGYRGDVIEAKRMVG